MLKSPTKFDERFKVISVPLFIPVFNLLSCELDHFTFINEITVEHQTCPENLAQRPIEK